MLTIQRAVTTFTLLLIPLISIPPVPISAIPFDQTPEAVAITDGVQLETYVVDSCVIKNGPNDYQMWYTHINTNLDLFGILDGIKPVITQQLIDHLTGMDIIGLMSDISNIAAGADFDALWELFGESRPVVGYATSTDGKAWTVVDDEVFTLGSGLWNLPAAPRIIKNSSTDYQIWYTHAKTNLTKTAFQNLLVDLNDSATRKSAILSLLDSTSNVVGYATSTNGLIWTTGADAIVNPGGTGIWDSTIAGSVIKNSSTDYQMWFTHAATDMTEADLDTILADPASFDINDFIQLANDVAVFIGYATSTDGQTWSVVNPSVLSGGVGVWNSVGSPNVIKVGTKYKMWFSRLETNLTSSDIQTLLDTIVALKPDLSSLWTVYNSGDYTVFVNALEDFLANKITDLRGILSDTRTVIAYATSSDGQVWQHITDPTLTGPSTSPWGSVSVSSVIVDAGVYEMWYIRGTGELNAQFLVDLLQGTYHPLVYERSSPRALTVSGITASNKVYNGNTTASINTSGATLSGVDVGDDVSLSVTSATGAFDTKDVGIGKPVTISGLSISGADTANYTLTPPTTSANITAKELTPAVTVANKVYDGTTAATILNRTLTGIIVSDIVILTGGTATFDNATAGDNKTVTVTDLSLTGADAGNYALSSTTATTTANITAQQTGGGGGGFGSQLVGIGLSGTSPFMDGNGRALTAGQIRTPDGKLSLTIPVGTYVWNAAGAAQSFLSATPLTEPPQAPPQHALILAYEMGPSGVTFNPAITLTMSYTDDQIPAGTRETDLYIAWWDGAQWIKLEGTVDTAANTITVQVTHFTTFALLAPAAPPPPTVNINTPVAGATFDPGNVTLSISVQNLKLVTGERPNAPGEGCVIYYLDVPIPTTPGQSAFSAPGTFKETAATSNTWTNLAPGIHTLGVQLVQNDHTPFNPPVTATVSVTIKEPAPPQTTAVQAPPPVPPSDGTKTNWIIIVSFLIAALVLGIVLYWRSRRPTGKIEYTNR